MSEQLGAVRLHARLALRDLIWWSTNRHRQGAAPNLAIFGSRRSGSTLLMQTVAANPAIKSIDQPDSVFSASAYQARLLPIRDDGQLHHLEDQDRTRFADYVARIVAGRLHVNEPWQFWKPSFPWRSDRIVFKLTDSHGAAEWMVDRFDWQPIVLFRHPLSQALSVSRLEGSGGGWHSRAPGFLRSEAYRRAHLDDRQEAYAHDIWRSGDKFDRHVLGWILENLPLLRTWRQRPDWAMVSYEAMVAAPDDVVAGLAVGFALPANARMRATLTQASRSTRGFSSRDRQTAIARGDHDALLGAWRATLDAATLAQCARHLETFGIDLYRAEADRPEPLYAFPDGTATGAHADPAPA
jgi:hypothetical protein